jgi:pimeloyl-ACP methyl ester carboxylesterase
MTHGDGFAPHPNIARHFKTLEGTGFFDSFTGGGAPVVLLVHGNGDEADTWRYVIPALEGTYRVLAPDLPGFGRSDPARDGSVDALAAFLEDFLELLRLDVPVHLVGSSLGAVVAAQFAVNAPERVRSLTLSGGASPRLGGVQANPGLKGLLEPGHGEAFYNGLRLGTQDAAYETLRPYYADLENLPEDDRAFLRERVWARVWSDTQRDAFFRALRSLFAPGAPLELPHGLPVQLIWGERDGIMPLESAHAILHRLPDAKLEVVRGSGHLPHQERPEAFVKVLERFLSTVSDEPKPISAEH